MGHGYAACLVILSFRVFLAAPTLLFMYALINYYTFTLGVRPERFYHDEHIKRTISVATLLLR